jgi:RNA polymerase sigma factor (sigma-70 family)
MTDGTIYPPPTDSLDLAIEGYVVTVHRQVVRSLTTRPHDADDVAQAVVELVLGAPVQWMTRYPDPVRLARVAARHACITFDRQQRVQRCEGARLHPSADGLLHPGRTWISGNVTAVEGGDELLAMVADGDDPFDDMWADRDERTSQLHLLMRGLSNDDRTLLFLVNVAGYSVTDLARHRGCARETVSRRMSRIRHKLEQNRAAMALTGRTTS